jgi:ribosomal protein S18 acetylase RimI-like enzyme
MRWEQFVAIAIIQSIEQMHTVGLRPATSEDYDFLYHLLKATMQEYVAQTWGWNEEWQQAYFRLTFDPAKNQIVVLNDQDIGVLSTEKKESEVFLGSIYILPEYQRRGIGAQLIGSIMTEAFGDGLPVTLRVLKVNPARRLYERLGFALVGETETHYLMKAMPT